MSDDNATPDELALVSDDPTEATGNMPRVQDNYDSLEGLS